MALEGKTIKRKTQEYEIHIKVRNKRNPALDLKLYVVLYLRIRMRLVEFCSTALGLGGKNNSLQKATIQNPVRASLANTKLTVQPLWTTHDMATARIVGTAGSIFFINVASRVKAHNNICLFYTKINQLQMPSHMVTGDRLHGEFSQHNWTLPY